MIFHLPPIDVETDDPNVIGEYCRDLFFDQQNGEVTGCYSTFEMRSNVEPISNEEREEFWRNEISTWYGGDDETIEWELLRILKNDNSYRIELGEIRIDAHWYWDGDGILIFVLHENDPMNWTPNYRPRFKFENTDCKKNYNWTREKL